MQKLIKVLFSQAAIVSVLLLLQCLLIIATILRINQHFVCFDILLKIISLVTVIIIINRHSNPMYKLSWIVPILVFPMFGGLFYLFITGQRHTGYFFSGLKKSEKDFTSLCTEDKKAIEKINERYPERSSVVTYIKRVCGLNVYRIEEAKYFPLGEDKFASLLNELEKAEKYIFLEYFIIKEGKMWDSVLKILKRKASEGVDVRVMYDGMGSMALLPRNYPKLLQSYGIKCRVFGPFVPFLSAVQNNRDHRKILVIDGTVAYTGGINLSDEYINEDYSPGHWKDMAVMVKGRAAFSFAVMFLHLWHSTGPENEDIEKFIPDFKSNPDENDNGYVLPYCDIPHDKHQTGEYVYLDIINKAKKYVYITTPYLILDHEMVVSLTNAAMGGIDVRIICPHISDHWYARLVMYSYYKELTDAGVKLYEYTPGFMHGKTFCSDDEVCVVGSINLDYRSLYLHFECAAWFLDCPVVYDVKNDFQQTLEKCTLITDRYSKMNPFKKLICALLRLFAPLM